MEHTVLLHFLWILPLFALTHQEMVHLTLTPSISTDCSAEVTLQCNVSSSRHGLSIRRLEWAHSEISLCSVNSVGNVSYNGRTTGDFHCEYEGGSLSLVLHNVQPEKHSGPSHRYNCKLHSNMGLRHNNTTVEIEECGKVKNASMSGEGPVCTFSGVRPDGEVDWFTGSRDERHDVANQRTSKSVDRGGWLTIQSYLLGTGSSEGPYNCSLRSSQSGRYLASALIQKDIRKHKRLHSRSHNGVRAQGFTWSAACLSVLLVIALN